jgi:branched-chain amino acid transport system permease protein
MALGFSFIFNTTASFNFAQGSLVTFGTLFAYTLYAAHRAPLALAVLLTVVAVGVIGAGVERVAIWPLARRADSGMTWLTSTLGVSVLLTGVAERVWGTLPLGVPNYVGPSVLHIGTGVSVATASVLAVAFVLTFAAAIELFQRFTLWGKVMRAMGDNRHAVELAGVNVIAMGCIAYAFGGALAGFAGFVIAPVTYADTTAGYSLFILASAAFAIGGFTSHWGSLGCGLLVGVIQSMVGTYLGTQYEDMVVLAVLILVLVVRPEGLLARSGRRLV